MGRFASTAAVYASARPPYGEAFFAAVARRLALSSSERLLDLGTGPGVLALGLAPHVGEVVAVDAEPAMVTAARSAATAAETRGSIRVIEARVEDLPASLGRFEFATIGRALHWMEPVATRATLGRLIAPGGSVIPCRASSLDDGSNPWLPAYEAARRRWSGAEAHRSVDPDAFFAGTPFRRREGVTVRFTRELPVARLADRILSMSNSSRDRIGDGVDAMRADVLAAMAPFAAAGVLREQVEASAHIFTDETS